MHSSPEAGKPWKIPVSVLVVMYAADGRFLMIERADRKDYWQSVTGSLDFQAEQPIEAAVRELTEETGFQASADTACSLSSGLSLSRLVEPLQVRAWPHQTEYEIFEHWRHRYGPGVTHNTEHWFAVCLPTGAKPRLADKEHVAFEWLDVQAAADRCFSPNNAQAIRQLSQMINEAK